MSRQWPATCLTVALGSAADGSSLNSPLSSSARDCAGSSRARCSRFSPPTTVGISSAAVAVLPLLVALTVGDAFPVRHQCGDGDLLSFRFLLPAAAAASGPLNVQTCVERTCNTEKLIILQHNTPAAPVTRVVVL